MSSKRKQTGAQESKSLAYLVAEQGGVFEFPLPALQPAFADLSSILGEAGKSAVALGSNTQLLGLTDTFGKITLPPSSFAELAPTFGEGVKAAIDAINLKDTLAVNLSIADSLDKSGIDLARSLRIHFRKSGIDPKFKIVNRSYKTRVASPNFKIVRATSESTESTGRHSHHTQPTTVTPAIEPPSAKYFLRLLLPRKTRQAIIGDLCEEFHEVCSEASPRRAQVFFWWQATREIVRSLLLTFLKLSGFATAAEALRRYIGN